ncbi:enamine deaminase RidA (YjgF/YER057c/UK114 family) [Ilumatobacter fluminis]|uniref:Enamine deaminase RidA (YjgF/YER057c/UK114 family) n=1 Tax=Ilumatobacter fluminis TaxID=467091 RepID=A0A4R7I3F3_9ACTN|nr:enamine deaminase RidA (YjgF/YER057c/UK114 family) [Ilumatobacter fluminis]
MPVRLLTPHTLPTTPTHHQVAVSSGSQMVFIAGQVALDASGAHVGGDDVAAQVEQCYLNVAAALGAVGATFDDVVKLTAYVTDLDPAVLPQFGDGVARACDRLGIAPPMAPLTGIGVAALAEPEFRVEIEAVAVLARR